MQSPFLLPCSQFLCRRPSVSLYLPTYLFPAAYLAVAVLCWKREGMLSQSTFGKQNSRRQQNQTSLQSPILKASEVKEECGNAARHCSLAQPVKSSSFSDPFFFSINLYLFLSIHPPHWLVTYRTVALDMSLGWSCAAAQHIIMHQSSTESLKKT